MTETGPLSEAGPRQPRTQQAVAVSALPGAQRLADPRILVWPTYSYPGNVGADSLYLIARNLLRRVERGRWYLVMPEWAKGSTDDLDDHPNVVKVVVPMGQHYRQQEGWISEEVLRRFSPQIGDDPIDVLLSMSPTRTMQARNAWSIRTDNPPMLVNWDLLVRDDKKGEMAADEVELVHAAAGYWAADLNVWESPVARKMGVGVTRKWLSSSAVRKVIDSSVDIVQGVPISRLRAATDGVEKRDRFSVYYGGRFSTSKRVEDLAEVIDKFYAFGRDVDFVVTTGSLDGSKRSNFEERFPQVELHVGLPQDEAWKVMASCHASVCFSRHELYGMAFWEQMATGLAVVMKAERWNADLAPPLYDLFCSSPVEAGALLRKMYDRWQAGESLGRESWAGWVAEHHDADRSMANLIDEIEAMAFVHDEIARRKYEGGAKTGLLELIEEVTEGEDEIGWIALIGGIRERSRIGKNTVGGKFSFARSYNMADVADAMRYLGWIDVGTRYPVWQRSIE